MSPATPRARELDLVGKVAVISGASRGIGRAVALNLASRGCSILGTCVTENGLAAMTALDAAVTRDVYEATSRARPPSQTITGLVADIFSPRVAATIADAVDARHAGKVDIFVNSACDPMPGTIGAMTADEVARSLLGNVQTPVLIVEELVRRRSFRPDSRIIYLSSVRARQPWDGQLMYAAGKSAGESLCRTWAQAFGGKNEAVSLPGSSRGRGLC